MPRILCTHIRHSSATLDAVSSALADSTRRAIVQMKKTKRSQPAPLRRDDSFKDFVLDQLDELPAVTCCPMFGGYGLYQEEAFFGILYKGRLYFKTNELTRPLYLKKGTARFRPNAKQTLKHYYEVPVDIIEDQEQLTAWAKQAASFREGSTDG